MRTEKWIITVSVIVLSTPGAWAEDGPLPAALFYGASTTGPVLSSPLNLALVSDGPATGPGGNATPLSQRETRDGSRRNPYAAVSQSGFRLNVNDTDRRPHLEYRFDANTSMRVRANREGVRVIGSWNF